MLHCIILYYNIYYIIYYYYYYYYYYYITAHPWLLSWDQGLRLSPSPSFSLAPSPSLSISPFCVSSAPGAPRESRHLSTESEGSASFDSSFALANKGGRPS